MYTRIIRGLLGITLSIVLLPFGIASATGEELTVTKTGTGSGKVTSAPSGIDCGGTCASTFTTGRKVKLTAKADGGATFLGWQGNCSGTKTTCNVTLDSDSAVIAEFGLPDLSGQFTGSILPVKSGKNYKFSVSLTVKNTGEGKAGKSKVKLYLSADTTYDGSDTYLGSTTFAALKSSRSSFKTYKYKNKTDPTGKYLIAAIDPDNLITETDKTNNTASTGPINMPNAADFVINDAGSGSVTVDWRNLSGALEKYSATVKTNGAKGTCALDGDNLIYTPNTGQSGDDSCILSLTDGEGSENDITCTVKNIDTTTPAAPVVSTYPAVTSGTTAIVSGTTEADAAVTIEKDGKVVGSTTADSNGNWSATVTLGDDTNTLNVTATDEESNKSSTTSVSVVVSKTVPKAPTVDSYPASPANSSITISGTADPNMTVTVKNGDTVLATTSSDNTGKWSATITLKEGENALSVTANDKDSGESAATALYITLDSTTPNAPVVSSYQALTTSSSLTISGTAEANSTITVKKTSTVLTTTTADSSGNWSASVTLTEGANSLSITAKDAGGNEGSATVISITLDTTTPAAPTLNSYPSSTMSSSVTISGTAEANSTITVKKGPTALTTTTADSSGNWSASVTLTEGANALSITAKDAAQNESSAASISITLSSALTIASLSLSKTVALTTDAEGGSARPEIVATADRIFVLYLGHPGSARTFDLKIYDTAMNTLIASKTLVSPSVQYGSPTDIRIASDGQYLCAFYETSTANATYLWGAKYALNDTFDLISSTATPIATSLPVPQLTDGGETTNDPAPLIGRNSVFVITRIRYSIAMAGQTVYRVREFDKNDFTKLSQFDLDLSAAADGRGRVTSLLYWNNNIYMALATTVSDAGLNLNSDDGALCDIILIKMGQDWTFDLQNDVKTISSEANDRENYITGLKADEKYFYMTYKQAVSGPPQAEQRAIIKIFDSSWNMVLKEQVRSVAWGPNAGEIRPALEVTKDMIYSAQDMQNNGPLGDPLEVTNAQVYIYAKQ